MIIRYDYNPIWCWNGDEKVKKNKFTSTLIGSHKRMRLGFSPMASSALATSKNLSLPNFYQEVYLATIVTFFSCQFLI